MMGEFGTVRVQSGDNFVELILSFHPSVGTRDKTQVALYILRPCVFVHVYTHPWRSEDNSHLMAPAEPIRWLEASIFMCFTPFS